MISKAKEFVKLNAKNLLGWKTNRKIVIFSVDDYGNVRIDSKNARRELDKAGLNVYNRFDALDALETREDLEMLYDTLYSVKDKNGQPAVFTPFALPCNINFEKMEETGFVKYFYELLPVTFVKLSYLQAGAYEGAWELWKEGIDTKLMVPQFHGREHLNLKVFEEKLAARDHDIMVSLKNRSYSSIKTDKYPTISPMAAFDFWDLKENERFSDIIEEGLKSFEKVFGYASNYFNPPGSSLHSTNYKTLSDFGIKYIDTQLLKNEHIGNGEFKRKFHYTGKRNKYNQTFIVRNVVFEPTEKRSVDWVGFTMSQIEAAFRWNRPAIISSHRVNFCGHIDENNRKEGLKALRDLLKEITERWPDVEFMAANELGDLISASQDESRID